MAHSLGTAPLARGICKASACPLTRPLSEEACCQRLRLGNFVFGSSAMLVNIDFNKFSMRVSRVDATHSLAGTTLWLRFTFLTNHLPELNAGELVHWKHFGDAWLRTQN